MERANYLSEQAPSVSISCRTASEKAAKTLSQINPADALRAPSNACNPDPRMSGDGNGLQDRWRSIAALELATDVPEPVVHHFETAKNVLLYAWFVYRFHMVAEQYVLTTLELALRERLLRDNLIKVTADWVPGLKPMLGKAREHGLISNLRFAPGRELARRRAEMRQSLEMIRRMQELGLSEISYDASNVEVTADDLAFDWIEQFEGSLPTLRNMHAHGTENLYPTVFSTFRIVHNLIGQLFAS